MAHESPEFVVRLRELLRSEYGMIRDVSRRTGINKQTLYNFAAGGPLSVPKLDEVARAMGHHIVLANERDIEDDDSARMD